MYLPLTALFYFCHTFRLRNHTGESLNDLQPVLFFLYIKYQPTVCYFFMRCKIFQFRFRKILFDFKVDFR